MRTGQAHARLYQRLRSVHLERAHDQPSAALLYLERSYDFDEALVDGLEIIHATTLTAPLIMLRSRVTVLEVNEPLYRRRLVRTLLTIAAARLSAAAHRHQLLVVTYAIENRDPNTDDAASSLRARTRRSVDRVLSRRLADQIDRIAFGTSDSETLYKAVHGSSLRQARSTVIPALPSPCDCHTPDHERDNDVVFVGAFDDRKGARQLLAAWPYVCEELPPAQLTLAGKGPLIQEVRTMASMQQGAKVVEDPSRTEIHALLDNSCVLVLLSQPHPRWREQVGLPIVEGLAHGCTIVTSEQTGLAVWLASHGHSIVSSTASPVTLAGEIVRALRDGRSPTSVLADLPDIDGRAAADEWMFADSPKPRGQRHGVT